MKSQADRVWDVLQDGRPHTIQEIHHRAGTMRLNSRIAELRKRRGVRIDCWRSNGTYVYQLVGPTAGAGESEATDGRAPSHAPASAHCLPHEREPSPAPTGGPMDKYRPVPSSVDDALAKVRQEHVQAYQRFLERVRGDHGTHTDDSPSSPAPWSPGPLPGPEVGCGHGHPLPHPTAQLTLEDAAA